MSNLYQNLYQFLIIIVLFSHSFAANSTQYDKDKVTIYIEPASIIDMTDPNGQTTIPNTVKFYRELIKSGKFNLVLNDRLTIGGNGSFKPIEFFKEKVLNELTSSEKKHILFHESLTQAVKTDIATKTNNGDTYQPNGYAGDMIYSFSDLVNKFKDDRPVPFAMKGNPPYLDAVTHELIFKLAADAFNEDFKLEDIKYRLNHSQNPVTCEASYKEVFSEGGNSFCLGTRVEVELRWEDESLKKCGLFDKEQNKLITSRPAILCEPKHVQGFESYYESVIEDACQNIENCFAGVSGEPLQELSKNFLEVMVHTKRDEIRRKNKEDESYNYQLAMDQLLKEVAEFSLQCQLERSDQYIQNELAENKDDINNARSLMEDSIRVSLGSDLTDEELRRTLKLADESYKVCLMINEKAGTASEGDEYYEQCLLESFTLITEDFISAQAKKQGDSYAQAKNQFIRSTKALCHISPPKTQPVDMMGTVIGSGSFFSMPGGFAMAGSGLGLNNGGMAFGSNFGGFGMLQDENTNLDAFSFNYDLPRCINKVSKLSKNYKALSALRSTDLNALSASFSPPLAKSRLEVNLEDAIIKCLDNLAPDEVNELSQRKCFEQGKKEGLAQSLYDSLQLSSIEGFDAAIYRYQSAADDILDLAQSNEPLKKCLEENVSGEEMANCQQIIFKKMKANGLSLVFGAGSPEIALAEDLKLLTKELSREISVFHWAPDNLTGNNKDEPIPLSSWNSYKYAVGREFMFHTGPVMDKMVPEAGATMAGRGLYAASDPNSSQIYGQTLFEIQIPKGSRFLDLREAGAGGQIPITKDTFDKLIAAGCDLEKIVEELQLLHHKILILILIYQQIQRQLITGSLEFLIVITPMKRMLSLLA